MNEAVTQHIVLYLTRHNHVAIHALNIAGQLVTLMCVEVSHNAHKLLHIPVIQSRESALETERKMDDDHEAGGSFIWSNL